MQVVVSRVGSGSVEDEATGKKSPWAKLYARDSRFTDNDMFTGSMDVEYPICDPETLLPSTSIADQIKAKFREKKSTELSLALEFAHKVSAKKMQIVVVGLAK